MLCCAVHVQGGRLVLIDEQAEEGSSDDDEDEEGSEGSDGEQASLVLLARCSSWQSHAASSSGQGGLAPTQGFRCCVTHGAWSFI
jgi:hypothetical protein